MSDDKKYNWIVKLVNSPKFSISYEDIYGHYYNLTKDELIDFLCLEAIEQESYLDSNKNYKHNNPISCAIREGNINRIVFYQISSTEYSMEQDIQKRLPLIKAKEIEEEKRIKEMDARRERLKLYKELKKEFGEQE